MSIQKAQREKFNARVVQLHSQRVIDSSLPSFEEMRAVRKKYSTTYKALSLFMGHRPGVYGELARGQMQFNRYWRLAINALLYMLETGKIKTQRRPAPVKQPETVSSAVNIAEQLRIIADALDEQERLINEAKKLLESANRVK